IYEEQGGPRPTGPVVPPWQGRLPSNQVAFEIVAADANGGKEVDGLKLTLSADKTETALHVTKGDECWGDPPILFSLVITNVSKKPVKLDTTRFGARHVKLEIVDAATGQKMEVRPWIRDSDIREAIAADFPILQPGQAWSSPRKFPFPGAETDPKEPTET